MANVTITTSAGAGGTIAPLGAVAVTAGNDLTVTVTPSSLFDISNVLLNASSLGPVSTYTLVSATADGTIAASFVQMRVPHITSQPTTEKIPPIQLARRPQTIRHPQRKP